MRLLSDALRGFRFPFQGAVFLRQHRTLWKWALFPALINLVVFAAALSIFISMYPALYDLSTSFIPPASPDAWYYWFWIAPLRLLAWLIGALLIVASLAVLFLIFLLLGTIIASPFLDVLAQRVEDIMTGRPAAENLTLRHALRSFTVAAGAELKRLGFFVAVAMTLFLLGLIPLLSPFTVIAASLFTLLFLPLEYASYAMDHRLMTFAQRRALIWKHPWLVLGFGAAASLTLLIPLLNFICLPMLVVGATLLMRHAEGSMPN
jgi:CysZ protein